MQRQKLAARAPAKEDKKEEALEKESESVLSINKAIRSRQGQSPFRRISPADRPARVRHAEIPAGQLPIFYAKLRNWVTSRFSGNRH